MGRGQKRNKLLVPQAHRPLYILSMKLLPNWSRPGIQGDYWVMFHPGLWSSRRNMVRKMIAFAESHIQSNPQAISNHPLIFNTN